MFGAQNVWASGEDLNGKWFHLGSRFDCEDVIRISDGFSRGNCLQMDQIIASRLNGKYLPLIATFYVRIDRQIVFQYFNLEGIAAMTFQACKHSLAVGLESDPIFYVSLRCGEVSIVNESLRAIGLENDACDRAVGRVTVLPGRNHGGRRGCRDAGWRSRAHYYSRFGNDRQILSALRLDERGIHPTFALRSGRELDLQPGAIWILSGEVDDVLWTECP